MKSSRIAQIVLKYIDQGHDEKEVADFFALILEEKGALHQANSVLKLVERSLLYRESLKLTHAGSVSSGYSSPKVQVNLDQRLIGGLVIEGENIERDLSILGRLEAMFK